MTSGVIGVIGAFKFPGNLAEREPMSLHVNKRKRKDGTVGWRVLRSEWAGNKVTYKHLPVSDLLQYGLSPALSCEEAIARVSQLNAQAKADKEADKNKAGALGSAQKKRRLKCAHLPVIFVDQFERAYLKEEMDIGPSGPAKYRKALFTWSYTQKLIMSVNLKQSLWHQHRRRFYSKLAADEVSPSYTGKILRILNLWGIFIAEKTTTSFITVPPPRGYDREMIADAYLESDKRSKTSLPITPESLEAARGRVPIEQYHWLYLSVWLGLRPSEVDGLHSSKVTREQGVAVLWVYQTKIRGVKKADRFKPIPLLYPEQKKCLDILKQESKRPLVKTVQRHVLAGANLYGGRKGFVDLMLSRGQGLEDISIWLGHATIERTWHSYKQRQRVSFRKVG